MSSGYICETLTLFSIARSDVQMLVSASLKEKRGIKIKVVSGVHYIIIDGATGESTWTLYLDSIITKLEQLCVCNNTIESLDPWEWLRGQEQKGQGGHIVRPGQGTWPEAEHGYASKWYSEKLFIKKCM